MSTSIHKGIVQFPAGVYGAANDPMDTTTMRDGVMNGLLHAADSMAQVRVCAIARTNDWPTSDETAGYSQIETVEAVVANQWYVVKSSPFGPWPLTLHHDMTPYKLRVRLAGAISQGSATITFRVVIAPLHLAILERDLVTDNVWECTTTSTTAGWLSGDTMLSSHTTYMTVTQSKLLTWGTRRVSVADAVSGGKPTAVEQVSVAAHVFAKTSNALIYPRLYGLLIAEYVGT